MSQSTTTVGHLWGVLEAHYWLQSICLSVYQIFSCLSFIVEYKDLESPKLTDDTQAYNLCPWSYANSRLLLDDAVIIVRGHGHRTAQSGTLVVTQRLYVVWIWWQSGHMFVGVVILRSRTLRSVTFVHACLVKSRVLFMWCYTSLLWDLEAYIAQQCRAKSGQDQQES